MIIWISVILKSNYPNLISSNVISARLKNRKSVLTKSGVWAYLIVLKLKIHPRICQDSLG